MLFHHEIIEAIMRKRVLMLQHDGFICLVEPHAYGLNRDGRRILLCYQTYGGRQSAWSPGWRTLCIEEIESLHGAGASFKIARAGYDLDSNIMVEIHAKVRAE